MADNLVKRVMRAFINDPPPQAEPSTQKVDFLSVTAPPAQAPPNVGKATPLDVAQTLALANNPERLPFDPGIPLTPMTSEGEPIQWPPAIGWNLVYDPNKKFGIPAYMLRAFAENCPPVRIVISQLIGEARLVADSRM